MRRRDRERIYQARRAGILARLTSSGVAPDRAEGLLAAWEAHATSTGLVRDGEAYWDDAWPWLEPRRWTKPHALEVHITGRLTLRARARHPRGREVPRS